MQGLMMETPLTIASIMRHGEKVHGDTRIVSVTADNPRHRYTFKDAFRRTRQLANAMDKLGLQQGDRIATLAWNDYRHFELYYALSCSGLVCHTINPRLFEQQLNFIINHAEDQYVFIDLMFVPLLEKLQGGLDSVKGFVVMTSEKQMPADTQLKNAQCYETLIAEESDEFEWPELDENLACSLCYTSGTTGDPKGVLFSHRAIVLHSYGLGLPSVFNLTKNDVLLPIVPMFHVNAWGSPYTAVSTGTPIIFPGPKMGDGEVLAALINEEGVTVSAGVPTVWSALLKYLDDSGGSVASLQRVVVGGAACPLSIMEEFENKHDVYTHAAWGMTEMSPLGTYNSQLDKEKLGAEEYARLRLKAGQPVVGVEMKIVDDSNQELPWDGVAFGSLKVRGPWVCRDYFRSPETSSFDEAGWFDTGDVATIDAQGYMQITDRSKDVIKSGGEWISSIDLENAAVGHPAIAEAAVIGVYHSKWTERPLIIVVKNQPDDSLTAKEVLEYLTDKVAKWWIPEDCQFIDALPHTATGKLDKKVLREQFKTYRFENDNG